MSPEKIKAITEKVQKLLALSKSSNQEEAELALSRANELMVKYNIEVAENFDPTTNKWTFKLVDGRDAIYHSNRISIWEERLILSVANYFGGRIIVMPNQKWDGEQWKDDTKWCYVGTEDDAAFAKLIFWDITNRIRGIFKKQKISLNITSLDSFGLGVVITLMNRMIAERAKMMQAGITERGLVTLDKKRGEFTQFYSDYQRAKGLTVRDSSRTLELNSNDIVTGNRIGKDMSLPVVNPVV